MVMIPTYNERENIDLLTRQILDLPLSLELTIVDDSSPDGTGEFVDKLAEKDPRVHPVHRKGVRGRASAGIAGFKAALENPETDLIIEMDADFSHDPTDIPRLVEKAAQYNLVIGSRYVSGGQAINCTARNVAFSRIINQVNRLFFRLPIHDTSGGYKCYQRRVLETINLDNYLSREYAVGIETLVKCKNHGFSMIEIPITFRNRTRGKSKANFHVLIEYPLTLLQLWFRNLQGQIR